MLAIDDDQAIASLGPVDAIADTVGGEVAAKLFKKIKPGGSFGYASVVPEGMAALNPAVTITRVFAKPDPSKVREFADDVRDGKFVLPIGRRLPLRSAAEAHVLGEKGGIGKIVLLVARGTEGLNSESRLAPASRLFANTYTSTVVFFAAFAFAFSCMAACFFPTPFVYSPTGVESIGEVCSVPGLGS